MALRPVSASLYDFLVTETVATMEATYGKEEAYIKLEEMGFRVGQSLFESLAKGTPRFKEQLEIIKFLCKEFWQTVYNKQIDNLRTNHKGVYVLHDHSFGIFTHMSKSTQYMERAPLFLAHPCGLLRGALASVGVVSEVKAEIAQLPACKFNVEIKVPA